MIIFVSSSILEAAALLLLQLGSLLSRLLLGLDLLLPPSHDAVRLLLSVISLRLFRAEIIPHDWSIEDRQRVTVQCLTFTLIL